VTVRAGHDQAWDSFVHRTPVRMYAGKSLLIGKYPNIR
jgi:hypothetical protein